MIKCNKKDTDIQCLICRDDWIRTSGLFVPNEARYRAALHPVKNVRTKIKHQKGLIKSIPSPGFWGISTRPS